MAAKDYHTYTSASGKVIGAEVLGQITMLVEESIAATSARVQQDIDAGKKLTDNPVALMDTRPRPYFGIEAPGENEEDVWLYNSDRRIQRYRFTFSEGGYISARNAWAAYPKVEELLKEHGWSDDDIYWAITDLFPLGHHVYGVLTALFHRNPSGDLSLLMGIRGTKLAGTNVGCASFPGGLVKPGESLENAAIRELKEEGARGQIEIFPGFSVGPHNAAPSVTFMRAGRTTSTNVAESYEWEGKTVIWVPYMAVKSLLVTGNNGRLVEAFRSQGLSVEDNLAIAPDAAIPAWRIIDQFVMTE